MEYKFRNSSIFYRFFDKKSDVTNVYLHGWGCDHKQWIFCHKFLKNQSSLFIDFPPFGLSDKDIEDWTIFTYANMVISLCEKLNIRRINLIGHSFGGRVAIILAVLCKKEVEKIVLVDSAGLKPRRSLRYYFKVVKFKILKKFGRDISKFGSEDFKNLSPNMKPIFISVVNTHLDDFLPFIRQQTLIIFGKQDNQTPIYMAKRFKRKIKNSKMVLFEGTGHFCFQEKRVEFLAELAKFLR